MLVSVVLLLLLQHTCDQTCATSIHHHISTGGIALGYTSELAGVNLTNKPVRGEIFELFGLERMYE